MSDRADVVVVGGGVAGVCAAGALAARGVDVLLVEDGGPSASAACLGHGLPGVVEAPHRTERSLGTSREAELLELVRTSRDALGELAVPGLAWRSDRPDRELDADVDTLRRHGLRAERAPGGWTCADAFTVRPTALDTLRERVRARVVDRVVEVAARGGEMRVTGVVGRWDCELVVLACGWRAPELDPWFAERVVPVREQALGLRWPTSPPSPARTGAGWTAWSGSEVSGCRWASPHLEVGETAPVPTPGVQARLRAQAALAGAEAVGPERAWIEAHTCDGLPFVGPLPGDVRRIALVGFCGNDWGLAPGAAERLALGLVEGLAPDAAFAPTRMP